MSSDRILHVVPASTYLKTWGALLVLTAITIVVSTFDFGSANLFVALGIATVKAGLVAGVFMHLAYGQKLNALVLVVSVLFLLTLIGLTAIDPATRAEADPLEGEHPAQVESPFAAGKPVLRGQKPPAEGAPSETPADIPPLILPEPKFDRP